MNRASLTSLRRKSTPICSTWASAQEAGGGEAGELIANEEMVKRLIVEMVGVIPSLQELAERLGFLVAGQRELRITPDDAVPEQGSGSTHTVDARFVGSIDEFF